MALATVEAVGERADLQARSLPSRSILDLPNLVEYNLNLDERNVFFRIFEFDYDEAPVTYETEEARANVTKQFGELNARKGLAVANIVIDEETLTNPSRANRPLGFVDSSEQIEAYAKEERNLPQNCIGCHPDRLAPQDPFGSIKGRWSRTLANAAAYTPWNSLVVPPIHPPMELFGKPENEEIFVDMIHTGTEWEWAAQRYNPRLRFPFKGYNGWYRAGGSIYHSHLQEMMRAKPFLRVERLRQAMIGYEKEYHYPYLDELAYCLRPLELVYDIDSAHIIFNPVPKKEKEVLIYANDGSSSPNGDLSRAAFRVIEWWVNKLGVTSFNFVIYSPPLGVDIREWGDWHNFFPHMRIVERGQEGQRTADIGSMELYAASVVGSDGFKQYDSFAQYQQEKLAA